MFFRAVSGEGGEQSGVGPVVQLPWLLCSPSLTGTWDRWPWRERGGEREWETGRESVKSPSVQLDPELIFLSRRSDLVITVTDRPWLGPETCLIALDHGRLWGFFMTSTHLIHIRDISNWILGIIESSFKFTKFLVILPLIATSKRNHHSWRNGNVQPHQSIPGKRKTKKQTYLFFINI